MRIIKNKKGSAFVTVLSVIMAITILVIGFTTISFWSYSATKNGVEDERNETLVMSIIQGVLKDFSKADKPIMISQLESVNPGNNWQTPVVGDITLGEDSGQIELKYATEKKEKIMMTTSINGVSKKVALKKTIKESVDEDLEQIYNNTFYLQNQQNWSSAVRIDGNLFFGTKSQVGIGSSSGVNTQWHEGNIFAKNDLTLNANSAIKGNLQISGNLEINNNAKIIGSVQVGGKLIIRGSCEITGEVIVNQTIENSGLIKGNVFANTYEISNRTTGLLDGDLSYMTSIRKTGEVISETDAKSNISGRIEKVTELKSLSPLPIINLPTWVYPKYEKEATIKTDNTSGYKNIVTSGTIKSSDISGSNILINTEGGDIHLVMTGALYGFSKNIEVQGRGRVFIYCKSSEAISFSGHLGKTFGKDETYIPTESKLFLISNLSTNITIQDGGRLDGYAYLQNSSIFSINGVGRGGACLVGSACAPIIYLHAKGRIAYSEPNLAGISTDGNIPEETPIVEIWEIDRYE